MNTLDIIILCCMGISIALGLWKGIIAPIVGVAALIVGAWSALKFGVLVSGWMEGFLSGLQPVVLKTVSFILIFICVVVAISLLGKLLEKSIKLVMLGWVNRLLGAIFALGCCLLILGLVSILFDTLYSHYAQIREITEAPAFIRNSMLYEPIHSFGTWIFPYLSKLSV